jgi:hypothetical protein
MQILIARNGKPYGPYTLDQIQTYLASGEVQGSDLAWHEGLPSWIPLAQVSGVRLPQISTPLPLPPPPPVTPIKQAPLLTSTLQTTDKKPAFNFNNVVKGCLGCFGIYLVGMLFIAACIWIFGSSSNNLTSSTNAVKATAKHIVSPEQKKLKLAADRRLRREVAARRRADQREQAKTARLTEETQQKRKNAVKVFANFINQGSEGQLFSGYGVNGDEMKLTVADGWYSLPKQIKLDRLKVFHMFWAKTCGKMKDPTEAKIKLESATGSDVGGWNGWSGYWVEDE